MLEQLSSLTASRMRHQVYDRDMRYPGGKTGRLVRPMFASLTVLAIAAGAIGLSADHGSVTRGLGTAAATPVSNLCNGYDPALGTGWAEWEIGNLTNAPLVVTITPAGSFSSITIAAEGQTTIRAGLLETFTWSTGSVTERAGQACEIVGVVAGINR